MKFKKYIRFQSFFSPRTGVATEVSTEFAQQAIMEFTVTIWHTC